MNSQIQYMCQLLPYEKYKTKATQKQIYLTSKQSRMQKLDDVRDSRSEAGRTTKRKQNGILAQKLPRRACRILSRSICHLYLTARFIAADDSRGAAIAQKK